MKNVIIAIVKHFNLFMITFITPQFFSGNEILQKMAKKGMLPNQGRLTLETPLTFLGGDSWSLRQDGVVDSRLCNISLAFGEGRGEVNVSIM